MRNSNPIVIPFFCFRLESRNPVTTTFFNLEQNSDFKEGWLLSPRGGGGGGRVKAVRDAEKRRRTRKSTPPIVKLEKDVRDWFKRQKPTPPIVKLERDLGDWFKRQQKELERQRRIFRARAR